MSFVLVHGGAHSSRCWEPTVPFLAAPSLVLDLPGRGSRPGPLDRLRLADFVDSAVADIEAADVTDAVLVGHSMAGLSMPGILERAHERFRAVTFVSCVVPRPGTSVLDMIPPDLAGRVRDLPPVPEGTILAPEEMVAQQCYDMDEEQTRFTLEVIVPEAYWPTREPVDLGGLDRARRRTWVRLLADRTFPPEVQDEMAGRAGCTETVDLDSGHMAMVSHPRELAEILNRIHATR
jgi:pimeloyl-ACP methyl ester carboxylesterase